MGCIFHKTEKDECFADMLQVKEYSWDRRDKINIKDYTVENIDNDNICRLPGTVNGQQFIIQNCKNSRIYIFDHMNTVTIDDCSNCKIILGPVKGSVFFRDCKDCACLVSCGQFRTRDCRKLDIFLSCSTQPIIEASVGVRFGCYQLQYTDLKDHFKSAGLSVFNNNWTNIHDFTPVEGKNNWSIMPNSICIEDYIPIADIDELRLLNATLLSKESLVPYTWGSNKVADMESCLVIFFPGSQQQERALAFIQAICSQHPHCLLMSSKEILLQPVDAEQVFLSTSYSSHVQQGAVIGLHFNCSNCIQLCQGLNEDLLKTNLFLDQLVYITRNTDLAQQQIQSFFNFANMHLTG